MSTFHDALATDFRGSLPKPNAAASTPEAEPARTSNGARATARELMALNPDLKYTEALRMVRTGLTPDLRQMLTDRRAKIGQKGIPFGFSLPSSEPVFHEPMGKTISPLLNPKNTLMIGLLGAEESTRSESRVLCDLRRSNLVVSGGAGTGCTHALQSFARNALHQPHWTVRSLDAKGATGEYLHLVHDLGQGAQSRFDAISTHDSETFAKAMLETKPGTEKNPLLLILDGGMPEQFVPFGPGEPAPCTTFGWLSHLLALMMDPNTVVALRSQVLTALPTEVREACTAHLVMGFASSAHYLTTFGQQPSPEDVAAIRHQGPVRTTAHLGLFQIEPGTKPTLVRIGRHSA